MESRYSKYSNHTLRQILFMHKTLVNKCEKVIKKNIEITHKSNEAIAKITEEINKRDMKDDSMIIFDEWNELK
jgi:hypothetical protein